MSGAAAAPAAPQVTGVPVSPSPRELHPKHPSIVFANHVSQAASTAAFAHPPESPSQPPPQNPAPSANSAAPADAHAALDVDISLGDDANEHASVLDTVPHEEFQETEPQVTEMEEMHVDPPSAPNEHSGSGLRVDPPAAPADPGSSPSDEDLLQATHQEMLASASAGPSRPERPVLPQNVIEDAMSDALRTVPRAGAPSRTRPTQRFYAVHDESYNTGLDESLTSGMVDMEDGSEFERAPVQGKGVLRELAARASTTPRPKRARLVEQKSPAILARGASISLARRAAATAKKRRDEARAELERNGISEGVERALEGIVGISASTRANVSQNRERRVQRVKWREEEVTALKKGVERYGVGRWAVILREFASAFDPVRISVDLKDKWRNIFKVPKSRVASRPRVVLDEAAPTVLAGHVAGAIQSQAHAAQGTQRTKKPQSQQAEMSPSQPHQVQQQTGSCAILIKQELVPAEDQMEREAVLPMEENVHLNMEAEGQAQSRHQNGAGVGGNVQNAQGHPLNSCPGEQTPGQASDEAKTAIRSVQPIAHAVQNGNQTPRKYPVLMPHIDRKRPREEAMATDEDPNRNHVGMACISSGITEEPQPGNANESNPENKNSEAAEGNVEINAELENKVPEYPEQNEDVAETPPLPNAIVSAPEENMKETLAQNETCKPEVSEISAGMNQAEVNEDLLPEKAARRAVEMQKHGDTAPAVIVELQRHGDAEDHAQSQMVDVHEARIQGQGALVHEEESGDDAMQRVAMTPEATGRVQHNAVSEEVDVKDRATGFDSPGPQQDIINVINDDRREHKVEQIIHTDTVVVGHETTHVDETQHGVDDGKMTEAELTNVATQSAVVSNGHLVHLSISGLQTEQPPEPFEETGLESIGGRHLKVDMESVFNEQVANGTVDMEEDMRRDGQTLGDDMVGDGQDILVHVHANGQVTQGAMVDGGGGAMHDFAV